MKIKRTKKDANGKVAVAYVKTLAKAPVGSIGRLTANQSEAGDFTADDFAAVELYYADRPQAGTFSNATKPEVKSEPPKETPPTK